LSELPNNLKSPNRREPGRYFHVLVLSSDGRTRRLNLSLTFLWLMGALAFVAFGALGLLAYLWVETLKTRDSLADRLEYLTRQTELAKYHNDLGVAPDQARRLLEELERVARLGDPSEGPNNLTNSTVAKGDPAALAASSPGSGPAKADPNQNLSNPGPPVEAKVEGGSGGDNLGPETAPPSPESEAYSAMWASWPPPFTGRSRLAVDDFKLNGAQFSFILKQVEESGQRERGRSSSIFAVANAAGQVKLYAIPDFPVKDPAAGFRVGARYNIVSSKVVRGRVPLPPGGKILSVLVVAWDEDSQKLVLTEKLRLGN
jgi:hypothetical protein